MGYRIKINGKIATVQEAVWSCSDPILADILNNWTEVEKLSATPEDPLYWLNSPSTPDRDWLIATTIAEALDGEVIDQPLPSPSNTEIIDGEEVELIY